MTIALFLALVAVSLLDVWSTRAALAVGAVEVNLLYGKRPSTRRLLVVKGGVLALVAWLLRGHWLTPLPWPMLAVMLLVIAVTAKVTYSNWKKVQ